MAIKAYKVINFEGFSVSAPVDGIVFYSTERKTFPKQNCGPLAAFEKVHHALEFLEAHAYLAGQIWTCEVKVSKIQSLFTPLTAGYCTYPEGTIFCDWIQLKAKVSL